MGSNMNVESFMTFNISFQIFHNDSTHSEFQSNCLRDSPLSHFTKSLSNFTEDNNRTKEKTNGS